MTAEVGESGPSTGASGFRQSAVFASGGNWWAVGMLWTPVAHLRDAGARIKEDRRTRSYEGFGTSCIRRRYDPPQYGLGWRLSRRKAESAAVAIADRGLRRLLAGYRLPDGGTWVLVIVDDVIETDGDLYFPATADGAAESHFLDAYERGTWDRVIIGDGFPREQMAVEATGFETLDELLAGRRGPPVEPLQNGVSLQRLLLGAAVVGILGYLAWDWYDAAVLEPERLRAQRESRMVQKPAPVDFVLDEPWLRLASVQDAFERCQLGIAAMPWKPPGWEAAEIICNPLRGEVNAQYRLVDSLSGSLMSLRAAFDWTTPPATISFSENGRSGVVSVRLPTHVLKRADGPGARLWTARALYERFWQAAQDVRERVDFGFEELSGEIFVRGYPTVPVPKEPVALRGDLRPLQLRALSRHAPVSWMPVYQDVPGLSVARVSYLIRERRWSVIASVYTDGYPDAYRRAFDAVVAQARRNDMTLGIAK